MIDEQIISEIDLRINAKFKTLEKSFEIFSLPLIGQFKMLLWTGTANSADLTPAFNIQDLVGRTIVIKSFRIVPYYSQAGGGVDIAYSDGTTETIPQNRKIDRLFDTYAANGTIVYFKINNTVIPLMADVATIGFPLDTVVDNIFYKFPQKVQNISMAVLATVMDNIATNAISNPFVKVVIECYLI